ncbi:MAG: hypothetical protein U0800_24455 [Isosphaeraceae bacterium]
MKREIPGTVDDPGRVFIYLEEPARRDFFELIHDIIASCPELEEPESGGAREERTRIKFEPNRNFLAISFNGDLEAWKRKIIGYCDKNKKKYAFLINKSLITSDGITIDIDKCSIYFE